MSISAAEVKSLRERTGAGMMDCKKALTEAEGNAEKAVEILRKKGLAAAAKRSGRTSKEGLVASYIHNGKIGVLVEVNCETDFVARNEDFQALVKDLTMHIAAANPRYVRREEVPQDIVDSEMAIYREQAAASGKPEAILDKIAKGKMDKFYSVTCLVEQPWVKDDKMTIQQLLEDRVSKIGENLVIRRFVRWELGETIAASDANGEGSEG